MSTKTMVQKNIEQLEAKLGYDLEPVAMGHTAITGAIMKNSINNSKTALPSERSLLAKVIRKIGSPIPTNPGCYTLPDDYHVVTGAGYGGWARGRAKQCHYAIVKEVH